MKNQEKKTAFYTGSKDPNECESDGSDPHHC